MKVSLIIPCCAKHSQYLFNLLKIYEDQSVLPSEVIISLSESQNVNLAIIKKLQSELWKFPVFILLSKEQVFAGINRNIACQLAKGDILVCQDADDFPHPQRIEIIKYFFEKYKLDHLAHLFIDEKCPADKNKNLLLKKYDDFSKIPFKFPKDYSEALYLEIHNGNIAISKKVFEEIKWSDKKIGQDMEFNKNVYEKFKNVLVLKIPLLVYKNFLSSHSNFLL